MPDHKPGDLKDLLAAEAAIADFVERRLMDRHGLLRCHLHARTLQPWSAEQLRQERITLNFYDVRRGDPVGQLTYEDSLMATGEYACSRLLKHEATGDATALAQAAQPIAALLRVLEEGAKYERGYLPKPHGGIERAAFSHEISVDQYIKVLTALLHWRKYCGPNLSRQIDEHIVAMADYHRVRRYQHPRREMMIVTPENRTHGIALFIPLLVLASRISGDTCYSADLPRFDLILEQLLAGEVPTNTNIVSLFMEGINLALQAGHEDDRLVRLMRKIWNARLADTQRLGLWNDDPGDTYASSRALRIAAFAPIVDRYVPGAAACELGARLLAGMTDPHDMRYAQCTPDELPLDFRYRASSLCETSISSWLVGYWSLMMPSR